MSNGLRAYLAVVIVGAVGAAVALGALLVVRVIQPGSAVVTRGLVPQPIRWIVGLARSRSMRVWSPDPDVRRALLAHGHGPAARALSRAGVVPVAASADADTVVRTPGAPSFDAAAHGLAVPVTVIELADPTDADALARAAALAGVDARLAPPIGDDLVSWEELAGDVGARPTGRAADGDARAASTGTDGGASR